MRRLRDEPLTIGPEVVIEFLERQGCPGMAAYVRHISGRLRDANQREQQLADAHHRLVQRLRTYEPDDRSIDTPKWTGD